VGKEEKRVGVIKKMELVRKKRIAEERENIN